MSIVTPSYNQSHFIEETIRSVLLQGYPNLEYIIIDGGSTDSSIQIINNYAPWLSYWVSELDEGQAAAVAYGFSIARGDIFAWINSDDLYMNNAFEKIATKFLQSHADVVFGNMLLVDELGSTVGERRLAPFIPYLSAQGILYGGYGIYQPAAFWRRDIYLQSGGVDSSFRFCMDSDLVIRFVTSGARFTFLGSFLTAFRVHSGSKTSRLRDVAREEHCKLREKLAKVSAVRQISIKACCWTWRLAYHICHLEFRYLVEKQLGVLRWVP